MWAVILTSVTTNTIITCSYDSIKVPNLNCRYRTLLGWYNEKNATSLIEQKLKYDNTADNENYSVTADDALISIANLFKKSY